jgi:hypothetical protein
MQLLLRRSEERLATLAKILKTYKVDKILGYHQLPPNKDRQIIFGWEEKNELPKDKDLILCRPLRKKRGDISLATKEDYLSYYTAIAGYTPSEFIVKIEQSSDLLDTLNGMAKFLTTGGTFSWGDVEFIMLDDKIG